MKRREFYKLVAELAARATSPAALLDDAVATMKALRGIGSAHSDRNSVLRDSPLHATLRRDDALGEIYQALNSPALERAYRATARERRKFVDDEIPSVTQLFTPRFVVEFLLHNTFGRLWMRMHPDSKLKFDLLIPNRNGHLIDPVPVKLVRDLRVLDPACGTMNFGVVAIEMLDAMYREELSRFGSSKASVSSEAEIPNAIVKNNLFGIDIDPTALELAAQTLAMKLRLPAEQCRANLWCGDALLDEELGARFAGGFDVVATNPPYLSARNLDPARVKRIKRHFPASWRDACACFIERSLQFSRDQGRVGILSMQSFMFTGAFQKLRKKLDETAAIEAIAHFGPGLFKIGNPGTLQTAAVVLRAESDGARRAANEVVALRLVDDQEKDRALRGALGVGRRALLRRDGESCVFCVAQRELVQSARGAWVYWLTPGMRRVFRELPKLREIAEPRQGLATTDNARFVRYWWEVEPTRADAPCRAARDTWFPYVKSGRFRRWFESPRHRVNWAEEGREIKQAIVERYPYLNGRWEWVAKNSQFYGRAGVTYSYLTAGAFSARLMPAGAIFDVAGSAIFPEDPLTMLAILNSSTARELLRAVNPTVNFQVGDLAELPMPCRRDARLAQLAARAVELQRCQDRHDEASPEFVSPAGWDAANGDGEFAEIEREIDRVVAELYGLEAASNGRAESQSDRVDLARRWVSFVIGRLLGRWGCEREFQTLQLRPTCDRSAARVRAELQSLAGDRATLEIDQFVGGIEAFLAGPFYSWHVKLYRSRPIYWALGDRDRATLVLHDFATRELMDQIAKVPRGWHRKVDEGVLKNLSPFADSVVDGALSRKLREVNREHAG